MEELEGKPGRARRLPLVLLLALLGAGLTGLLGGQANSRRQVQVEAVSLIVRSPAVIRSGMVFETVIEVRPTQPVADLAIGVSAPLWREMTINTMMPAAREEGHKDGYYLFGFGPVQANETFRVKIDGQINPPLFAGSNGEIATFDADRKLAGIPTTIMVLP
jgi:hypothetical protein